MGKLDECGLGTCSQSLPVLLASACRMCAIISNLSASRLNLSLSWFSDEFERMSSLNFSSWQTLY